MPEPAGEKVSRPARRMRCLLLSLKMAGTPPQKSKQIFTKRAGRQTKPPTRVKLNRPSVKRGGFSYFFATIIIEPIINISIVGPERNTAVNPTEKTNHINVLTVDSYFVASTSSVVALTSPLWSTS